MKKFKFLVCLLVFIGTSAPAMGDIIYYDDCEDQWDKNHWSPVGSYTKYEFNNISVSSEQARNGSHSYKFQLNTQENLQASNWNDSSHVNLAKANLNFQLNTTYWVGFSIFIPSNFVVPSGSNWIDTFEFHKPSICNVSGIPIAQYWRNGNSCLVIKGSDDCNDSPSNYRTKSYQLAWVKGAWNDVVINLKFSYKSGGFVKMWLNGNLVVEDNGINTWPGSPYFKIGLYGRPDVPTTIYYDEIRFGDSNSFYQEVAPKTSSNVKLSSPILKIVQNIN